MSAHVQRVGASSPPEVVALIREVEARGASLSVDADGTLVLDGASKVPAELKTRLKARRFGLTLAVVGEDVAWRVLSMIPDVQPIVPIGVLAARSGAWPAERGRCVSCGDHFESVEGGPFGYALRCAPCVLAAKIAIDLGRTTGDGGAPCAR